MTSSNLFNEKASKSEAMTSTSGEINPSKGMESEVVIESTTSKIATWPPSTLAI